MDKSRNEKYLQIIKRAEHDGIFTGSIISALKDIESADKIFDLSLDEWLNADFFDFTNDFIGILDNIKGTDIQLWILAILFLDFQKNTKRAVKVTHNARAIGMNRLLLSTIKGG